MSRYGGGSDDRYGDKSSYRGGSSGGGGYGGGGGFGGGGGDRGGGGGRGGDSMGQLGAGLRTIQWDLSKLPVFEKNFYIEHPAVSNRPENVSDDWRRSKEITIIGKGIPKPVFSFEEASMPGNFLLRRGSNIGNHLTPYNSNLNLFYFDVRIRTT